MPKIQFDPTLVDTGFSGFNGHVNIEAVMLFPRDAESRKRHWSRVFAEYYIARRHSGFTPSLNDFDGVVNGLVNNARGIEEQEITTLRNGFLVGHYLKWLLRIKMCHANEKGKKWTPNSDRWCSFLYNTISDSEENGDFNNIINDKLPTSWTHIRTKIRQLTPSAHLWAAYFDNNGRRGFNWNTEWDEFISEAHYYQWHGLNNEIFSIMDGSLKSEDIWIIDKPLEYVPAASFILPLISEERARLSRHASEIVRNSGWKKQRRGRKRD